MADVIIALIAAAGGFLGSVLSNNKQLAIVQTKLDTMKEELTKQGSRIDRHNHIAVCMLLGLSQLHGHFAHPRR